MRRLFVILAFSAVMLTSSGSRVSAESHNVCLPWSTYAIWTVVFCDYSLWDLYEGIVSTYFPTPDHILEGGGGGGSRGFYGDDPPSELDMLIRWCWFEPNVGLRECKWSHTFEARAEVSCPGACNIQDPPGQEGGYKGRRAVLVAPPNTTAIEMYCVAQAQHYRNPSGPGSISASATARSYPGSIYLDSVGGFVHITGGYPDPTYTSEGIRTLIRNHSGYYFPSTVPSSWLDTLNYPSYELHASVNSTGKSGFAKSYISCAVTHIWIHDIETVLESDHTLFNNWWTGAGPGNPYSPIVSHTVAYTPVQSITQTVSFSMGVPSASECYDVPPAVGPYTVTIPGYGDWVAGFPGVELCISDQVLAFEILEVDFILLLFSLMGLSFAAFLIRLILS